MTTQNTRLGIALMIATTFVFAMQDGISRHLAETYNVLMVVMIRYWFFAAFVMTVTARRAGGVAPAARTSQPILQIVRGLLLAFEVCLMVWALERLGLAAVHAVFTCYPLIVAALSGPILGEQVGWRRWTAIGIGFIGILIILRPGGSAMQVEALVPLFAAFLFALYGLLTRHAAARDAAMTSFFWTGVVGAVAMTIVGVWAWQPMTAADWGWMGALCVLGSLGHYLLIKTYDVAEASAVQPFAYFQLVFATAVGVLVFDETLYANVVLGAIIVVGAGLFTLWRERATQST